MMGQWWVDPEEGLELLDPVVPLPNVATLNECPFSHSCC